jgi:hypothetical protein
VIVSFDHRRNPRFTLGVFIKPLILNKILDLYVLLTVACLTNPNNNEKN